MHILCDNEDIPKSPFMAMVAPANLAANSDMVSEIILILLAFLIHLFLITISTASQYFCKIEKATCILLTKSFQN